MPVRPETIERLSSLPNVTMSQGALLSRHTRFGIGGPADALLETQDEASFIQAIRLARCDDAPHTVIGEGTNLIVSDAGFPGIVLRFTGDAISMDGATVRSQAGAGLQA